MSIKSMTGFGRSQGDTPSGTYTVELKSVNNRYLDIKFRIPSGLSELEMKLRKLIKKRVSRGSLTVMVARSSGDAGGLTWDKGSGDELRSVLSSIADAYSMEDRIDLADFVKMGNLITTSSGTRKLSTIWKHIEPLINKALEDFCLSREREGDFIEKDIKKRVDRLSKMCVQIKKRAPVRLKEYAAGLKTRVKELSEDAETDESRLSIEVALMADKLDISEEITRFDAHIEKITSEMDNNKETGKKMGFILQEMLREVNTISSKANDLKISHTTVEMKNEIESIKEQSLNIE